MCSTGHQLVNENDFHIQIDETSKSKCKFLAGGKGERGGGGGGQTREFFGGDFIFLRRLGGVCLGGGADEEFVLARY